MAKHTVLKPFTSVKNDKETHHYKTGEVIQEGELASGVLKQASATGYVRSTQDSKTPAKHETLALVDKIALLGEIEHARHHCARSAHVAEDHEQKLFYQVKASQAKRLRREMQATWLDTGELDWCLVKTASRIKWLNEEVLEEDLDLFSEIEDFADSLLSHALKRDLSGCQSCHEDEEGALDRQEPPLHPMQS